MTVAKGRGPLERRLAAAEEKAGKVAPDGWTERQRAAMAELPTGILRRWVDLCDTHRRDGPEAALAEMMADEELYAAIRRVHGTEVDDAAR